MGTLGKHKTGLALGSLLGLCHFSWAVLVGIGFAQPFIDWIFRLHFIEPPYTITPFHYGGAALLIAITFVFGYLFGWLLAAIWNWLHPTV